MPKWLATLLFIGIGAASLSVGLSGFMLLGTYGWKPQLGTLADWFAAIGTVAAFAAGLVVIRRDNKWKRDEEQRRHEELERQQAELITGWWDDDTDEIELINNSTGIAYVVVVNTGYHLPKDHKDAHRGYYNGLNHAETFLPPGTKKRIPAQREYSDAEIDGRWLQIRFTDAHNHHWFRGGRGDLRRTDEGPMDFLVRVAKEVGIENPVETAKKHRKTDYRPKRPIRPERDRLGPPASTRLNEEARPTISARPDTEPARPEWPDIHMKPPAS